MVFKMTKVVLEIMTSMALKKAHLVAVTLKNCL